MTSATVLNPARVKFSRCAGVNGRVATSLELLMKINAPRLGHNNIVGGALRLPDSKQLPELQAFAGQLRWRVIIKKQGEFSFPFCRDTMSIDQVCVYRYRGTNRYLGTHTGPGPGPGPLRVSIKNKIKNDYDLYLAIFWVRIRRRAAL